MWSACDAHINKKHLNQVYGPCHDQIVHSLTISVMTHIMQILGIFDIAISCWICSNVISMVPFTHVVFFVTKNHAIKRGLEQKNCTVKKLQQIHLMCVMALTGTPSLPVLKNVKMQTDRNIKLNKG